MRGLGFGGAKSAWIAALTLSLAVQGPLGLSAYGDERNIVRSIRGTYAYQTLADKKHRGWERFQLFVYRDGSRSLQMWHDLAARNAQFNVSLRTDSNFRPIEAFLTYWVDGGYKGSAWIRVDGDRLRIDSDGAAGPQQREVPVPDRFSVGSHPVSGDGWHMSPSAIGETVRATIYSMEASADLSKPLVGTLVQLPFETLGEAQVSTLAGSFETTHYRLAGVNDVWVTGEDRLVVRMVNQARGLEYVLVELDEDARPPSDQRLDLGGVRGVQEMVVSVADLSQAVQRYRDIAGWDVLALSSVPQEALNHWGVSESARQAVLGHKKHPHGFLRLIQFGDGSAAEIRSSARPFDSGGIFNFNLLAKDMGASFGVMRRQGFVGFADPSEYTIFGRRYSGAMLTGPDGVVVNLLSRLDGDYGDRPPFESISHVINATQVVADYEGSVRFYKDQLGFVVRWEAEPVWDASGDNNFSLPNSLIRAGQIQQRAISFSMDGEAKGGTIEVLSFEGIEGRDFSSRAHPPHRGVLMYGIHTPDVHAYRAQLVARGIETSPGASEPLATFQLPPYGAVDGFGVRAPEGAWLQFFGQR